MSRLVWLIPLFPLVGALVNALFGRRTGHLAHWIAVPALGLGFITSCFVFARVLHGETYVGQLFPWINAGSFTTAVAVQVDQLTAIMLLVVTGVGFLIHLYSAGYMHDDPSFARFFTYLNLFVFSMVMLVLAGNFLLLYVFWEAVGLCSYLLIGFWYEKKSATDAGKKAFIVTRVGDCGFALGIMLIWTTFGSLNYGEVFGKATDAVSTGTYLAIALLLFTGAVGKSAQLPLFTWLPDAMEGPTPVSALIHAATMVTAGVYMVARCHKLFEMAPLSLEIVAWVGGLTALFAATIGLAQTDIKRVLAYSTISQLGYMFVGVGVGAYAAGIFHLVTHAFFKALLFLGAGSVIHGLSGEQDLRKMGGLAPRMMTTTVTFLVGAVGLAGIPPLAGFFSKDEILASAFHEGHVALWVVLLLGVLLTAFYTTRVVFLGVFVAWLAYGRGPVDASRIGVPGNALHRLVLNKYYVDEIYDALFVRPIYRLALWCARVFDLKVIDGIVNGVGSAIVEWALGLRRIQTGFVMNYALGMLLGAVAIVAFLLVTRP